MAARSAVGSTAVAHKVSPPATESAVKLSGQHLKALNRRRRMIFSTDIEDQQINRMFQRAPDAQAPVSTEKCEVHTCWESCNPSRLLYRKREKSRGGFPRLFH